VNSLRPLLLTLLAALTAQSQAFEVASIKPSKSGIVNLKEGNKELITVDPATLILRNLTLKSCLRWAYDLHDYQMLGPAWLSNEHYDIVATTGSPATPAQMRGMLRLLLTSRFQIARHHETKELPVYELLPARSGLKLTKSKTSGDPKMLPGDGALHYTNYTMAEFAEKLPAIPFRVDRPVIDKTGLPDAYDFRVNLADNAVEMKRAFENSDGPLAEEALRQMGLRLQPRKDLIDVLVIDRAEKIPVEN
jgi:uncharacterized protein (TIGR03435 family)